MSTQFPTAPSVEPRRADRRDADRGHALVPSAEPPADRRGPGAATVVGAAIAGALIGGSIPFLLAGRRSRPALWTGSGPDHEVAVLNSLIRTTIDSADGFERSAANVEGTEFEQLFRDYSGQRRDSAAALQVQVRRLGGEPAEAGSLKAGLHRRFEDLRQAIAGGDKAVIEEVERGEDYIKAKYELALADPALSEDSRAVLEEAYQSVRSGHDRARALKARFAGEVTGITPGQSAGSGG